MISKIVFILLTATVLSFEPINDITLIDVDSHLEVVLLDRLDPGVKKTKSRYFENQIASKALFYFKKELKESRNLTLTIDMSMETHIPFDKQGFPNPTTIKTAIKKLNKNYIQRSPYIQLITNVRIEGDAVGETDMLQRIQPNIQVIIKVFNKDGKLSTKSMATSVYDGFVSYEEIGDSGFSKSSNEHIDRLIKRIDVLLTESITRATKKLVL